MKQKSLLKTMLLLCALVAGSSSVWADDTYTKVTSTSDLVADAEYILLETSTTTKYLANTTYSSSKYGSVTSGFTISGNNVTVTTGTAALVLKLGGSSGAWTLYDVSAKQWVGKSSSNTNFARSNATTAPTADNAYYWTIKTKDNELAIYSNYKTTSTDHTVRYWGRNNSAIGPYNGSSYPACILYKKVKQEPTITFNNGSVNVGKTLNLSTLFSSNSTGAVTYSITSGDSYASLDGTTLTGVAAGIVTVQASQAATSSYNAKTATATITVNAALTLSSIAITTAPTKTVYNEGQIFDPTGMVVTATYSDSSTDDVTASCTWTPSGVLTLSDTEIKISYTENAITKTATQDITVNPYVQPTSVTMNLTQTFWGQSSGHTSGQANDDLVFTGTQDNVTVSYLVPKGSYYYYNTSNTRPYDTCTLKFDAPASHVITSITFTPDGTNWNDATPTDGAMNTTNNKKWEGQASSVSFNWATTGTRIKTVVVTLSSTVAMTITSAGWASFSCDTEIAIPDGVTAYYAQQKDDSNVTLKEITGGFIPANTGVVVSGAANTYNANVTATGATLEETNLLKPWLTAGTPTDSKYYTLAVDGSSNPIFKVSSGGTLAAGKSYLVVSGTDAPTLAVDFGETTGVNTLNVERGTLNGEVYNLNGQRVAQPTKGLYIVNGKKVIIK